MLPALLEAEGRQGIAAHADVWVAIELVGKLVDPKTRPHARAALKKLYYHCGGPTLPRMVVDCEEQVSLILLGKRPEGYAQARERIGNIIERVAKSVPEDDLADVLPAAGELQQHIQDIENQRASFVFKELVQVASPGASRWDAIAHDPAVKSEMLAAIAQGTVLRAIAASEVARAHLSVGMPVPPEVPPEMLDKLLKHFRYPFEVEVAVIQGVVEFGWAMGSEGRRNAVWDAQIAFNAGQTIAGIGMITLVTNDELFHDVAKNMNHPGLARLPEYLGRLGIAT